MSGEVFHGRDAAVPGPIDADVVICGGGAGGSMAARELAKAGLRVVLLEEGGDHVPSGFTQREDEMIPRLFQEMGGRRTDDLSILILSGRGLGGSTIHNTNLSKRAAPEILDAWRDQFGLEASAPSAMAPFYEEVERDSGVVRIADERVNANNDVLRRGVTRLGWKGGVLSHNRDARCLSSGFCELGCAYDGKLNARRILVPEALRLGALVYTDARVDWVKTSGGRASGVEASLLDARGRVRGRLTVRARAVCLAGSAVGSAALALRSELKDPHDQLGKHLRIHPAAVIAGTFDEPIDGWRGIPQSYECTELLDLAPGAEKRVWIVPSFAHPVGAAAQTPGFGPELLERMRGYRHLAVLVAMIHDETEGRVYLSGDRTRIAYEPIASDRAQLALGARGAAKLLFAAGAREVMIPAVPPIVARTERELDAVTADRFLPHDGKLSAVHPMGSLRMGRDPAVSAVDPRGEHHHVKGLYVVDGSLFPTSLGGPPQISIYAFAMRVARDVAADLGKKG